MKDKPFRIEVRRLHGLVITDWQHWKSYATAKDRNKAFVMLVRKDRNPHREFRKGGVASDA